MVFAELAGYFDDSGTHSKAEAAICAGYIATVKQWRELERNWKEVDSEEHFWPLHTTDLLAGYEHYKGWDETRKARVLSRLIGFTNLRVRVAFISGVVKKDYDDLVPDWLKAKSGNNHYTFCAWSTFALIAQWRERQKIEEPIEYVFDQMGKGKGEIISVFDSFIKWGNQDMTGAYDGGLSFQSKNGLPQLQAADIIASAAGWHINNRTLKGRSSEAQLWFEQVMSLKPRPMNRYFDSTNIPEFVQRMEAHKDDPRWGVGP